jgi:hypothetical protein
VVGMVAATATATGTTLFRSMVARKMARALLPRRVIAARGLHGGTSTSSGVGRSSPKPSCLCVRNRTVYPVMLLLAGFFSSTTS